MSPALSGREPSSSQLASSARSPAFTGLRKSFQPELGEDAILAHQRHRIGNGRNRHHLEKRRQQSLASALHQQRLRDLERHSCAAQRLARIVAAVLIGIDHGQRFGHAFRLAAGDDR